jgi:hypothetical protein
VALTHVTSIPHAEASIRNTVARDDPSVVDSVEAHAARCTLRAERAGGMPASARQSRDGSERPCGA